MGALFTTDLTALTIDYASLSMPMSSRCAGCPNARRTVISGVTNVCFRVERYFNHHCVRTRTLSDSRFATLSCDKG